MIKTYTAIFTFKHGKEVIVSNLVNDDIELCKKAMTETSSFHHLVLKTDDGLSEHYFIIDELSHLMILERPVSCIKKCLHWMNFDSPKHKDPSSDLIYSDEFLKTQRRDYGK